MKTENKEVIIQLNSILEKGMRNKIDEDKDVPDEIIFLIAQLHKVIKNNKNKIWQISFDESFEGNYLEEERI